MRFPGSTALFYAAAGRPDGAERGDRRPAVLRPAQPRPDRHVLGDRAAAGRAVAGVRHVLDARVLPAAARASWSRPPGSTGRALAHLWSVLLPLGRPAIVTMVLLTFMWTWNEFLIPLVMVIDERPAHRPARPDALPGPVHLRLRAARRRRRARRPAGGRRLPVCCSATSSAACSRALCGNDGAVRYDCAVCGTGAAAARGASPAASGRSSRSSAVLAAGLLRRVRCAARRRRRAPRPPAPPAPTWTCCSSAPTRTTRRASCRRSASGRTTTYLGRCRHHHPRRGRRQRGRSGGGPGARADPRGRGTARRRPGRHHRRVQPRRGRLLLHRVRRRSPGRCGTSATPSSRVVRIIRQTRPNVLLTMDPAPSPGNHGNHQEAARVAARGLPRGRRPQRLPRAADRGGAAALVAPAKILQRQRPTAPGRPGPACATAFVPADPARGRLRRVVRRTGSGGAHLGRGRARRPAPVRLPGLGGFPDVPADPARLGCDEFTQIDSRVPVPGARYAGRRRPRTRSSPARSTPWRAPAADRGPVRRHRRHPVPGHRAVRRRVRAGLAGHAGGAERAGGVGGRPGGHTARAGPHGIHRHPGGRRGGHPAATGSPRAPPATPPGRSRSTAPVEVAQQPLPQVAEFDAWAARPACRGCAARCRRC